MLTKEELCLIDGYFILLFCNAFCITIRSKCTNHEWHIIVKEYYHSRSFEIWHRHKATDAFHPHGHASTLNKALCSIKDHDVFQLNRQKKHPQITNAL